MIENLVSLELIRDIVSLRTLPPGLLWDNPDRPLIDGRKKEVDCCENLHPLLRNSCSVCKLRLAGQRVPGGLCLPAVYPRISRKGCQGPVRILAVVLRGDSL